MSFHSRRIRSVKSRGRASCGILKCAELSCLRIQCNTSKTGHSIVSSASLAYRHLQPYRVMPSWGYVLTNSAVRAFVSSANFFNLSGSYAVHSICEGTQFIIQHSHCRQKNVYKAALLREGRSVNTYRGSCSQYYCKNPITFAWNYIDSNLLFNNMTTLCRLLFYIHVKSTGSEQLYSSNSV